MEIEGDRGERGRRESEGGGEGRRGERKGKSDCMDYNWRHA